MAGLAFESTLSSIARKRKTDWWTLPCMLVVLVMLIGLWQVYITFHAIRFDAHYPLGRLHALQELSKDSRSSKVQKLLEEVITSISSTKDFYGDMKIIELRTQLEELLLLLRVGSSRPSVVMPPSWNDVARENLVPAFVDSEYQSLHLDNFSVVEQLEAKLVHELQLLNENLQGDIAAIKSENQNLKRYGQQLINHLIDTLTWKPLKDLSKVGILGFLSDLPDRGDEQGPPQLYEFPSNLSQGRHLCFLGNDTRNGTRNLYTYAWEDSLPRDHIRLYGTTLISENQFDFENPWHSMYNLVQFVYWKQVNKCRNADRLLLYHWSELRRNMGAWITQVFTAADLPTEPYQMPLGNRSICFEKAVVSRNGIGGVPRSDLQEIFKEVRCLVRHYCKVPVTRLGPMDKQRVHITVMVRSGTREWKNHTEWEEVVARECAHVAGCEWSTMHVANLTFCEQVAIMSRTDILVSVHGAQLANMIFMSPGGRVLEMFPKGWLELAGNGQYIYKFLADWSGLFHEGYWRDMNHGDCPFGNQTAQCMTYFKDLPVGINATHISLWLHDVVKKFNDLQVEMTKPEIERRLEVQWDTGQCSCTQQP